MRAGREDGVFTGVLGLLSLSQREWGDKAALETPGDQQLGFKLSYHTQGASQDLETAVVRVHL